MRENRHCLNSYGFFNLVALLLHTAGTAVFFMDGGKTRYRRVFGLGSFWSSKCMLAQLR